MDKEQLAKEFVLKQPYLKKGAYLSSEELYEVNIASFLAGCEAAQNEVLKAKTKIKIECLEELWGHSLGSSNLANELIDKLTQLKTELNEQD